MFRKALTERMKAGASTASRIWLQMAQIVVTYIVPLFTMSAKDIVRMEIK